MKQLVIVLTIVLLSCYSSQEILKEKCITKENAIQFANEILTKEGFDINEMKISVKEKENEFIIAYSLNDSLILGGGAEIIINKEDCKTMSEKLYQ
jgi:hypothetical protein